MGVPNSRPTAGMQVLYGTLGATASTPLGGLAKAPKMPEVKSTQYESTRIDQLNVDGSVDETVYMEPGLRRNPGTIGLVFGVADDDSDALFETLQGLVEVKSSFRVKFKSGATLDFPGYIFEGPSFDPQDKGEVMINVTVQLYGLPVYTPA